MSKTSKSQLSYEDMHADLSALIACDTCFPPAASYGAFCDLIETRAADLGGRAERVAVPPHLWQADGVTGARVNLVLRPDIGPADAPEALIYFHADTAPVGDGWTRPPLMLTREGTRLFGRGTADMKGCIAAVLAALRHLKQTETALAFRPVLAICTDEEGGLYPGIRYLAETRTLPDVLLNLNGGAQPRIWGGCLGSMDIAVTVQGLAAHSGRPDQGINALEEMLPVLAALQGLRQDIETRTTAMPPPPGAPDLCARLSITAIRAGDKGSALPGQCRVVINRRYLPEENPDAVRAEIDQTLRAAITKTRLRGWRSDQIGHLPPVTDPSGPWTDRWTQARAVAADLPVDEFTLYGSGTSSDFGWVQKAGIQHMLLGGLMRPDAAVHGPDEHTTVDDMETLAHAVALFLSADFPTSSDQRKQTPPNMETS
ncbi:M20 family metallopeptidase [Roseobacter sp.]|uniref:M20 family metallopeptidase n=1 Tax=Roseobacter sp. TaxID=1907202 RepID=UPI003298F9A0